jgi:hypothetical protein
MSFLKTQLHSLDDTGSGQAKGREFKLTDVLSIISAQQTELKDDGNLQQKNDDEAIPNLAEPAQTDNKVTSRLCFTSAHSDNNTDSKNSQSGLSVVVGIDLGRAPFSISLGSAETSQTSGLETKQAVHTSTAGQAESKQPERKNAFFYGSEDIVPTGIVRPSATLFDNKLGLCSLHSRHNTGPPRKFSRVKQGSECVLSTSFRLVLSTTACLMTYHRYQHLMPTLTRRTSSHPWYR